MKFADPHKSMEGSTAMFVASAISVWTILLFRGGIGFWGCGAIALTASAMSALVELCTKDGYDTFTCPTIAMLVILPLIHLIGG